MYLTFVHVSIHPCAIRLELSVYVQEEEETLQEEEENEEEEQEDEEEEVMVIGDQEDAVV